MSEKPLAGTEPPKKRRFWQFHLSTAVLLMFLSGVFLHANSINDSVPISQKQFGVYTQQNGFPFAISSVAIKYRAVEQSEFDESFKSKSEPWYFSFLFDDAARGVDVSGLYDEKGFRISRLDGSDFITPPDRARNILWDGVLLNLLIFIAANLVAAFAFEYLIRRRESRKP